MINYRVREILNSLVKTVLKESVLKTMNKTCSKESLNKVFHIIKRVVLSLCLVKIISLSD